MSRCDITTVITQDTPRFLALLERHRHDRVVVLGHMRPDGDCIGAQIALCRILRAQGTEAICVNHHAIPRTLASLQHDTPFYHEPRFIPAGSHAICVDCSDLTRLGPVLGAHFPRIAANIDHHISNTNYACENIVHPDAAAACQMIAALAFDARIPLDPVTAQALYTGIVTDTGQFKYRNTTAGLLTTAARLLEHGAAADLTTRCLYENDRLDRLLLLQRCLGTFELHHGGRICAGHLTAADYAATRTAKEDAEGFIDYARNIASVAIALLLEETPAGLKGSLRAKDPRYRLDRLAATLNGGGHTLAAGFNLPGATLATHRSQILAALAIHMDGIDAAQPIDN
ncbi:MAG: DHH family phosphoesterase [Puniceicoccales bacterium]|jgi:phosphoesterase RecJ-like protein|nr:DHH family phosphoesterase [Puniceicoccales bacterium]